jgi:hypothetical protein
MAEQQLGYDPEQERAREPGHEDPLDDGVRDGAVVSMCVLGPRLVVVFGMMADDSGHGELPPHVNAASAFGFA